MINTLVKLQETDETVRHLLKRKNVREDLKQLDSGVAYRYLGEIYKGNGWVVSYHNPSGHTSSLLLSYPKNPRQTVLIVRIDCSTHELTFDDCRDHLLYFENELSALYSCSQFCLIALNSFEARAEKLESFNLLLQDWSYVEELIENYNIENIKEPRIQLFAHNKIAYRKVLKKWDNHRSVAVVQATGTGKSFLIAKILQDFTGSRRLVMAPSNYIIDQLKEHIRWGVEEIEFMTYTKSMFLSESEVQSLRPELIVLDEFHRCGAEEWGRGVQNILNANTGAKLFGTSATPVRYLDNGRDMSKELFDGNIAENLSLAQAIVRNILPMPKYVCALYTLAEEAHALKAHIAAARTSEEKKNELNAAVDTFSIDWEQSRGIPHVLKKYLRKTMLKFIVFCKDEAHLLEMEPIVKKWFKDATNHLPVKTFRVHDNEPNSIENLETFKFDTSGDGVHLLFSINMLNEGLHVNDVHGVILLRPTESPNIFYQQIGRCLKAGHNQQPVIFDFVNNFKSIRANDFMNDLEFARTNYIEDRRKEALDTRCPKFTVIDEVREITEVFGEIRFRLDNWEDNFKALKEYYKKNNTWIFKENDKENLWLARWCVKQRVKYRSGRIQKDRMERLKEINFPFSFDDKWNEMFEMLVEFKKINGHCNVSRVKNGSRTLNGWSYQQRSKCYHGKLEAERQQKLTELGIEWNFKSLVGNTKDLWEKQFNDLCEFRKKFGHTNVSGASKDYQRLGTFVNLQRQRKKRGTLEQYRVDKLNDIGFDWDRKKFQEGIWQQRFDELIAFKNKYGHYNVTESQSSKLSNWIRGNRSAYSQGAIDPVRKQKLDAIGFEWRLIDDAETLFEKRYVEMSEFKNKNGHLNFHSKSMLGVYSKTIRNKKRQNKLAAHQEEKLNAIGFSYQIKDSGNDKREKNLKKLEDYFKLFGHCNVLIDQPEYSNLYKWLGLQRVYYRRDKLPKKMIARLESMKIDWGRKEITVRDWDAKYMKVLEYFNENNHLQFSEKNRAEQKLAGWLNHQRQQFKNERLNTVQIEKLKAVNFNFVLHAKNKWEQRFSELVEFKKINSHTRVPLTMKELSRWCIHVRVKFKKGKLSAERIKRFEELGFEMNPLEEQWSIAYEELKESLKIQLWQTLYLKKPRIASFINTNRVNFKNGTLSEERIMLLNMLGISWDPKADAWDNMYNEMVLFKQKYRHLRIPSLKKEYSKLLRWAYAQRKLNHNSKLSPEQVLKLNKIGFEW